MAETLGNILKKLAEKAGVTLNAELTTNATAVPDDVAKGFTDYLGQDLITVENAKNHLDLDNYFKAKHLDGVDKGLKQFAEKNGLSADEITEAMKGAGTYAKLGNITAKLSEKIAASAATPADKQKLVDEITKLNKSLADKDELTAKEKAKIEADAEASILDYANTSLLTTKKYANKEIAPEVNATVAKTLIQNELEKIGAKLVRKDGKLKLIQSANPDLDYMENNKPVTYTDLADRVLANNKLLEVSGATPPKKMEQQNQHNGKPLVDNSKAVNAIDKQLQELGVPTA